MKRVIFPYGIRFQENGRIDVFPAVEIFVLGRNRKGIRALFHIDSGATTSILPFSDSEVLGTNAKSGAKVFVRGVSGESLLGYRSRIVIVLSERKITIPVIFIEGSNIPRILGREGVFSRFGVLFDEPHRRVLFSV